LICTILAIPLPILLPAIPGLTPRLGPALLPAPTAVLVVAAAGGLRAGGTPALDTGAAVLLAPSLLAPALATVPLVEVPNEEAEAGRLDVVEELLTAEPRVAEVFLVVGTNPPPPGLRGPAVD
jgi:hypothetical protein